MQNRDIALTADSYMRKCIQQQQKIIEDKKY